MLYHVEGDPDVESIMKDGKAMQFPRNKVKPILFLSKLLSAAESRYWPTELEVAGVVWLIRKTRHLISVGFVKTVIFTDHSAATFIAKQTSLTTVSIVKPNLRLIRASQYISQFNLDVRYRPGKIHLVPDSISRLLGTIEISHTSTLEDLDEDTEAYTTTATLVEMDPNFKKRIIAGYQKESQWKRILEHITPKGNKGNESKEPTSVKDNGMKFHYDKGLIYYISLTGNRLYISKSLHHDIFRMAHDDNSHRGFHRAYEAIVSSMYLRKLTNELRTYTKHCPSCQRNQTQRHKPYGGLHPIRSPPVPYHTIAMDFIVELPVTSYQSGAYDILLTITCKFTKKVLLEPGQNTWDAVQWGIVVITTLMKHDWGIPIAILTDRDTKFM